MTKAKLWRVALGCWKFVQSILVEVPSKQYGSSLLSNSLYFQLWGLLPKETSSLEIEAVTHAQAQVPPVIDVSVKSAMRCREPQQGNVYYLNIKLSLSSETSHCVELQPPHRLQTKRTSKKEHKKLDYCMHSSKFNYHLGFNTVLNLHLIRVKLNSQYHN